VGRLGFILCFGLGLSKPNSFLAMIWIKPMILEFCPDLSQRVNLINNLPITRRMQPEEEERIQQAT
jgi:hypothetical protein